MSSASRLLSILVCLPLSCVAREAPGLLWPQCALVTWARVDNWGPGTPSSVPHSLSAVSPLPVRMRRKVSSYQVAAFNFLKLIPKLLVLHFSQTLCFSEFKLEKSEEIIATKSKNIKSEIKISGDLIPNLEHGLSALLPWRASRKPDRALCSSCNLNLLHNETKPYVRLEFSSILRHEPRKNAEQVWTSRTDSPIFFWPIVLSTGVEKRARKIKREGGIKSALLLSNHGVDTMEWSILSGQLNDLVPPFG
ncbi:hypothetical protein RRG08_003505 [Elysia crispata]|uniref:Uncharacterized protein n=1 Tax=Elysia crispata TaxID=231223 RepID=A0AAE0Y6E3_9GAST|nr:hypothetical protein RRG08_003505 [Elysia crispata]